MYLKYWELKKHPFENVPAGGLFFRSPQHEEARIRLSYVAEHRKGAAMITGEVGSGKTTVARAFSDHLSAKSYETAMIVNPAMEALDLIRSILIQLGENGEEESKAVLLNRLQKKLETNADRGISTVLIIDEVQVIDSSATFEELRMLLNMQNADQFLITLILLGQTTLKEKIAAFPPLKERISVRYHLPPLDYQNTWDYISFRLGSAGAERNIFTKEAVAPLYEYSGGIPLRINNICDRSLLMGMMGKTSEISADTVKSAAGDLR